MDRRLMAAVDRVARAVRHHRQAVATDLGLTTLQVQLLEVLATGLPPRPRAGDLAAELDVTQPTVSDALATLSTKGLLERAPDPTDRRATRLTLTTSGERVAERLDAATAQLARAFTVATLHDQATTLATLLRVGSCWLEEGLLRVDRSCLTCTWRDVGGVEAADHCQLLDRPLPPSELRVDCPEHTPLDDHSTRSTRDHRMRGTDRPT